VPEPLWKPRPAKVDDLAGARLAAVAEFRAAHPEIPEAHVRVVYTGSWLGVYDGGPRPSAPPAKAAVRLPEPELEESAVEPVPPPSTPATVCTGTESWFPRGAKTWLNLAKKHGWKARATRAVGPRIGSRGEVLEEHCRTLCIAMQNDRGWRLVIEYRWVGTGKNPGWKLVDILDGVNAADLKAEWAKERIAA
jgi:hypothetical protein